MAITLFALTIAFTIYEDIYKNSLEEWTASNWKKDVEQNGDWGLVSSTVNEKEHFYLKTLNDSRFFTISKKFDSFSNVGKNFSFFYVTSNTQSIECGGSYVKLFPSTIDQKTLKGGEHEDKYNIMFGPDICGSNKKIHLIISHKEDNLQNKKNIKYEDKNEYTMLGFTIFENQTYSITVNENVVEQGSIKDDYPVPPEMIDDVSDVKPNDWVDEQYILDESDIKPDGWDDIPEMIEDPDATIPEDWDEDDDGVWEPPTVKNPDWKGEWKQKMIENPNYKGVWYPKKVPNPLFDENEVFGIYSDISTLGIEIWQVRAGTLFGKFIITDEDEVLEEYKKTTLEYVNNHNYIIKEEKKALDEKEKKIDDEKYEENDGKETEYEDNEEEEEKDEL